MRLGSCAVLLFAVASLSAGSLAPADALAQPAPDARETARPLAEKAYEAFEAKRWADAIDYFRRAETIYHALPHLLFIARAQAASGKLLDARTTYDSIVKEQLTNYAPDAFRQAQDEARREGADLARRIPRLESVVTGADPSRVRLKVDGTEVFGWSASGGIPLDPGTHVVVAVTDTGATVDRSVQLREGETTRVELPVAAPTAPPPDAAPAPSTGGSYVPAILAFGVGGVGLAIGAVTGLASLGKVSDIEEDCDSKGVCPKSLEGEGDSAKTLGTVSTVAFVIGAIGVGAGVVLVVTRSGKSEASQPSTAVRVGPGSLSLLGTF